MTTEKVYFLSKVRIFAGLTTHELSELANDFQWQEYEQGADIIKRGQADNYFYVLAKGKAEVLVSEQGINSWKVNSFGPCDTFGEISLFTGKPAPTTVRCLED